MSQSQKESYCKILIGHQLTLIGLIFYSSNLWAFDPHPEWFNCQRDEDCALVSDACAWPDAVNKSYITAFHSGISNDKIEHRCAELCRFRKDTEELLSASKNEVKCFRSKCKICFSLEQVEYFKDKCKYLSQCQGL